MPTKLTQPLPILKPDELERAAKLLMCQLPDYVGRLAQSIADDMHIPLWHFVCGTILAAEMSGTLSAIHIDPSWDVGVKQEFLKCQFDGCQKLFKPEHINQSYCSNECGLLASGVPNAEIVRMIDSKNPKAKVLVTDEVQPLIARFAGDNDPDAVHIPSPNDSLWVDFAKHSVETID